MNEYEHMRKILSKIALTPGLPNLRCPIMLSQKMTCNVIKQSKLVTYRLYVFLVQIYKLYMKIFIYLKWCLIMNGISECCA